MTFVPGFTRLQKKKWMDAIVALGCKVALYSTTTALDATVDPATPLAYGVSGELTDVGTGYTAGGYVLAGEAVAVADTNGYGITFDTIALGAGTVATGTYGAMIYDPADANKAIAVCQVNITVGSSGTVMNITVPVNALKVV